MGVLCGIYVTDTRVGQVAWGRHWSLAFHELWRPRDGDWGQVHGRRAPRDASATTTTTTTPTTTMDDDDVDFDPDAYDDGVDARESTEVEDVVEDVVVEALDGKRRGVRAFEDMCDEVIGTGAVAANATWQRAITKLQRDGRFKTALATHNERRGAFEGWKAKARDGLKKRSGSGGDGGGEEGARKKTKYEREQAALRAREIEANRAREQAEYVAKKRKAETLEAEAERAFEALCAEKVKTYARSYDEAWTRDLQYDALGRNNVDALRGGELRARELFEAHRERVEKTLKSEFSKLCARVLDRLIVAAIDAGVGENKGTVDSIFAGALSYAKASEEEYELIDEAVFNLVPDADRASMWTSCATNILARHDIIVDTQEE